MRLRLALTALAFTVHGLAAGLAAASPAAPAPKPWTLKPGMGSKPGTARPAAAPYPAPDTTHYLPDSTWLIRVGPRVTRVKDYVREFFLAYPERRPHSDSLGRVEFLNTLISSDLLGLAARARNTPLDFTDRATMRETEDRALSDAFFLRYVVDVARVPESEVQDYVKQRAGEGHFRRIVFADRETATRVRSALLGGKLTWLAAVKQYSLVKPTLANPDGDMGWVTRMGLEERQAQPLFRLQPGGISEIVRGSAGGFEISQMVERRTGTVMAARTVETFARHQLRDYHISLLADSIQTLLREHIGMNFDTANVATACLHFRSNLQSENGEGGANINISGDAPELSALDTSLVLARWREGGRFSLGELVTWINGFSPPTRPDVSYPEAMMAQVSSVVLEPYRATMARERGIDKDPEVISKIDGKRERLMVEHMYQDSVAAGVWVSREERKAYYEKHLPDYYTFPEVDFAAFYRHNRASAESLAHALDTGAQPQDLIAADSLRGLRTGSLQHRVRRDPGVWDKLLFEELRPGQSAIVGPNPDGKYAVLQLRTYSPGRQLSYDEAQGMVDDKLQGMKSEERLQAWLERLRKVYAVESRPELVMQIKMVDPTAD